MILPKQLLEYFKSIQSKVSQSIALSTSKTPYWIEEDENILRYEVIREVWQNQKTIKAVCDKYNISRTYYYETEKKFIDHGVIGLFSTLAHITQYPNIEQLIVMSKQSRPSLSNTTLLRIAHLAYQLVPFYGDRTPLTFSGFSHKNVHPFQDKRRLTHKN